MLCLLDFSWSERLAKRQQTAEHREHVSIISRLRIGEEADGDRENSMKKKREAGRIFATISPGRATSTGKTTLQVHTAQRKKQPSRSERRCNQNCKLYLHVCASVPPIQIVVYSIECYIYSASKALHSQDTEAQTKNA